MNKSLSEGRSIREDMGECVLFFNKKSTVDLMTNFRKDSDVWFNLSFSLSLAFSKLPHWRKLW